MLKDFPETKFVLMHIAYPYQDEAISLAKHYTNAFVDLCWAWIINPAASVRLVKEFVLAAPANKLFTFGGDYLFPECVYGHAKIARRAWRRRSRSLSRRSGCDRRRRRTWWSA
jgi:predicted TIM-barrel fold metal-dependent hydrolase